MSLQFVVLSDLHVMPEGELAVTLDTGARLEQAVAAIAARYGKADFCVLAGDLVDAGQPAAYRRLQQIIARIPIPVHLTLGNHDDRDAFLTVFGLGYLAATGKVDQVLDVKGYRLILLDSSEPGRVDGVLTEAQIHWLRARLAEALDKPVIVILHHNANALQIESDDIRILEPEPFVAALKSHPDIRQVIAGHVHLTSTAMWRGIPFTTLAGNHYYCTLDQPEVPMRRWPRADGHRHRQSRQHNCPLRQLSRCQCRDHLGQRLSNRLLNNLALRYLSTPPKCADCPFLVQNPFPTS